jgi:steroid delta-isomerase-like uncharacterized protein
VERRSPMGAIRELAERAFALYNSGDIDAFLDVYAADAVLRAPEEEGRPFEGPAAIRGFWAEQFSAFPDSHITIDVLVEEGDTVAAEFTYTGTNAGPMAMDDGSPLPATGKRIEMKGMQLIQFGDGKIVRHAIYHDSMTAMRQLGLMPEFTTA